MNYTYILECADHTLYTGWTNDLAKRLKAHNEGKGSKYTRVRLPVRLLYVEEYETKQEAMVREYRIKRMSRLEKLALAEKMKDSRYIDGFRQDSDIILSLLQV